MITCFWATGLWVLGPGVTSVARKWEHDDKRIRSINQTFRFGAEMTVSGCLCSKIFAIASTYPYISQIIYTLLWYYACLNNNCWSHWVRAFITKWTQSTLGETATLPCVFRRGARQRAHGSILHGKDPLPCEASDNVRQIIFAVRFSTAHNWRRRDETACDALCRAPGKNARQRRLFVMRQGQKRTANALFLLLVLVTLPCVFRKTHGKVIIAVFLLFTFKNTQKSQA
jgi:hypothetical protein